MSVIYVALDGGTFAGLYDIRLANMAMGAHHALLPIVVTCARREDAEAIEALSIDFAKFSRRDAHALAYSAQESSLDIPNTKRNPIYAIRTGGEETGIWVGFKWDRVMRHLGHSTKGKVYSGQFRNIKEANIYMLDKPGYNFPLRSGDEIPRPTTTLPLGPDSATAAAATASALAIMPPSPSKLWPSSPSKAAARPASPGSSDDSFATARGDTSDDLDVSMGRLTVTTAIPDNDSLVVRLLAQFIAHPTGMGENNGGRPLRFLITFGECADEFLALKMPSAAEL
ncbi:hypothetical protein GSI_00277 [Ganoderma sinense ZZ0214-1]|uniref:Uncharacterized protein n=1 Tax=Ganoderma sinense ZZ0214-1 TaxID=1077348 RepID=A0A2G8SSM8_9APHY|nr:hypothetical protein GSI_00277 [Ganoderma sinense ZZ0214-1]